jgi:hypothetical protein
MKITERRLRSIIRNVIKEELTNDLKKIFDREMGSSLGTSLSLNEDNYEYLIRKYVNENCHLGPQGCSVASLIKDLRIDESLIKKADMDKIKNAFDKALHDEFGGDLRSFVQ